MKRWALAMMLFPAVVAVADEAQLLERIERLEQRIDRLERELEAGGPVEAAAPAQQFSTRYWLTQQSPFDGGTVKPSREGLMELASPIGLDPARYGVESEGFFSSWQDPSRYPVVALAIEGQLLIRQPGNYRLVVKATPPREVGGAGNVEVGVTVSLAGEPVLELAPSSTLAPRGKEILLPAGRVPLLATILARSPGFGPSPTGTKVFIGLQAPGAIRPVPLSDFLTPAGME